jgi:hypothetical protein
MTLRRRMFVRYLPHSGSWAGSGYALWCVLNGFSATADMREVCREAARSVASSRVIFPPVAAANGLNLSSVNWIDISMQLLVRG